MLGGIHAMEESPNPLSTRKYSFPNADLNSNQILTLDLQKEEETTTGQDKDCRGCLNVPSNQNKDVTGRKPPSPTSPTNAFSASLHQKDLSYDDLSKNIDANLAEIDMETFRSEDINSILALPAIYSGHFDSVNHGEQCASVSGSLLNGLEIETSVSNRISEDEISICKDEPLFSPQREPPAHERTISVDSLDNSSSYDQDLVLTCKANKNNYTIVFEGSETQFSEDSEFHSGLKSSEVVSSASEDVNNENSYASGSMIQSDLVFTTWSNLKRAHICKKRKKLLQEFSIKSKSLPNLSYQSAFFNDKLLQWARLRGDKYIPFSDIDLYPNSGLQVIKKCGYPYTLNLVKLFMKYKVTSRSSVFSSEHSSSTNSLALHSLNNINHCSQSGMKTDTQDCEESDADLANQNFNIKHQISLENLNTNQKRQLIVDNIRILDWHPTQNVLESNNNTNSPKSKQPNSKNSRDDNTSSPTGECDNSQYFEDSLIEAAPILQMKNFNALPIKEEEETDISSGDEVMKTSMSSDCNNCSSSSTEPTTVKNNSLDVASNVARPDIDHNLERIINIFPSCKTNVTTAVPASAEGATPNAVDHIQDNQSQGTQTKHYNSKNCVTIDSVQSPGAESQKASSRPMVSMRCQRHSTGSRGGSPHSSGYLSSRHSSADRIHRSFAGLSAETLNKISNATKLKSVLLTTTRNCSTQVPVHVKDGCMQTSTLTSSYPNIGFFFRNSSKDDLTDMEYMMEQNSQSAHEAICPSNKPSAKDDKCIYVCYPNYSLPDLSFLKSMTSEESRSVFLSPTKYKPPQRVIHRHVNRPRSSEGLDSDSRKRLSNIKDWESLSVLLPDDLKNLLSEIHLNDDKSDSLEGKHSMTESKSFPSPKLGDKKSHSECSDVKKSGANLPRQCSLDSNRKVSQLSSSDETNRRFQQSGVKSKSQSQHACNCYQCVGDGSTDSHKDILKYPVLQTFLNQNVPCLDGRNMQGCSDHKSRAFLHQAEKMHSCSRHISQKHFVPVMDPLKISSNLRFDEPPFMFPECKDQSESTRPKHSPSAAFKSSHKCKVTPERSPSSSGVVANHNAMCCNEFMQKNPAVELDHPVMHSTKTQRLEGCGNVNSDDFLDMEKAPQEFLVSPIQNTLPYPTLPDSYEMQNSGNLLFHESLKRKTGLVENLQKATLSVAENHSLKHDSACCNPFSVGQKILTSLCPALHTILSDGLLPSVQGFFGPLPNSPWKVTEASIQQEQSKKEVQELMKLVNSEKLLTDSTYRFNAFVMGLLNLGSLEWWLDHLLSSHSLISHHYHPTALLSLLALPMSSHLQNEVVELVSPLTTMPFSLDLSFETKIAAANSHEKCSGNCCKPNRSTKEQSHNMLPNFPFCATHQEQKGLKPGMKPSFDTFGTKTRAVKADPQDQVWPGISINPFPNMQQGTKSPKKAAKDPGNGAQKHSGVKDKKNKKRITDLSLCSSTDSGCSSQVCQSHDISLAAIESVELENHASGKNDGHQFRKLQQKWEKITLGMDKPGSAKNANSASSQQNNSNKKPEPSGKKPSRCQAKVQSEGSPKSSKMMAMKRAVSQPPSCKSKVHSEVSCDKKSLTPDVIASAKISKNRSQIPTLKTKSLQPKSKIPIQRSENRTQSANREARNT